MGPGDGVNSTNLLESECIMPRIAINQPSDLVRHYRHRAKKEFGQHFLVDPGILEGLADFAGVESGDAVLEIGPGCGTLTWTLLERGARVTAVELEREAASFLRDIVELDGDLELVEADVLDVDLEELLEDRSSPWRCVSNLPFGAATEIYFHLAEGFERFALLVLMFQREVAHRMVAAVGDDAYGALSLNAQLFADLEIVQELAPGAFQPPPDVHGGVVRVDPIEGTRIPDERTRSEFRRIVRTAFQKRRKILPNALSGLEFDKETLEAVVNEAGLERTVRPERVPFEAWREMAERIAELRDASDGT